MEKIVCSAIHCNTGEKIVHQPINIDYGIVFCALRHHTCMTLRKEAGIPVTTPTTQGFITDNNRFVDRVEAYLIALKANQITRGKTHHKYELFSEDIY